jgi:preprotein translocase subunit SecA
MLDAVKNEVTRILMTVKIQSAAEVEQAAEDLEDRAERISNVTYTAPTETGEVESTLDQATLAQQQQRPVAAAAMAMATAGSVAGALPAGMPRVGRNDPCPCGSGKKFKNCHGQLS